MSGGPLRPNHAGLARQEGEAHRLVPQGLSRSVSSLSMLQDGGQGISPCKVILVTACLPGRRRSYPLSSFRRGESSGRGAVDAAHRILAREHDILHGVTEQLPGASEMECSARHRRRVTTRNSPPTHRPPRYGELPGHRNIRVLGRARTSASSR